MGDLVGSIPFHTQIVPLPDLSAKTLNMVLRTHRLLIPEGFNLHAKAALIRVAQDFMTGMVTIPTNVAGLINYCWFIVSLILFSFMLLTAWKGSFADLVLYVVYKYFNK